jgi:hypothetical protein
MNAIMIQALVRHLLTAVGGGFFASYGISGEGMEALAGAVATLAGLAWSAYDKHQDTNKPKDDE